MRPTFYSTDLNVFAHVLFCTYFAYTHYLNCGPVLLICTKHLAHFPFFAILNLNFSAKYSVFAAH